MNAVRPIQESRNAAELPAEDLWHLIAAGSSEGLSDASLNRTWAASAGKAEQERSLERLIQLPEAEQLAGPFFSGWMASDSASAISALEAMPETSPLRQSGIAAAALALINTAPEKSRELAQKIDDPAVRGRLEAIITEAQQSDSAPR